MAVFSARMRYISSWTVTSSSTRRQTGHILHRDNGEYRSAKGRYGLEAHDAHFWGDAVWCGTDEEKPLCGEVWDYDHVAGMWDLFHEHVPCNDEVGEHEEHCSQGEDAASLQQRKEHHGADEACIYADAGSDDARLCSWGDLEKCYGKQCRCAENHHSQVPFGLRGQFPVVLDLLEVSFYEIDYEPDVCNGKASNLSDEILAGSEVVTDSREEQGQGYLPWA